MKKILFLSILISSSFLIWSCSNSNQEEAEEEVESEGMVDVILSVEQCNKLNITIEPYSKQVLDGTITASGKITTMPQSEALVTSYIGANVKNILVHEGQDVKKGQVLCYLSHPDLIEIQSRYISAYNRLSFAKEQYQRQKSLYENNAISGKDFQQIKSEYLALQGEVNSAESQLTLLGINSTTLRNGKTLSEIPVVSPIHGTIETISVETGQYADPQQSMFRIINTDNLYADILIFEKDLHSVSVGQTVDLTIPSSNKQIEGKISSIGKSFASESNAVHVRIDISNSKEDLIAGMFTQAKIKTSNELKDAIREEGVVESEGKSYIFTATKQNNNYVFHPIEVTKGTENDGIIELLLETELSGDVVIDGAYYILSEMKKSETGEDD